MSRYRNASWQPLPSMDATGIFRNSDGFVFFQKPLAAVFEARCDAPGSMKSRSVHVRFGPKPSGS